QRGCRGELPPRCLLRRSDPQGHETRRSSHRTADEVRAGGEHEDGEGARHHDPAVHPGARGQGDRMNDRRRLLIVLGATALAPQAVFAQAKQAPGLIGWLNSDSRETSGHYPTAFKEGLAALGWTEGAQYVIEERWADGRNAPLQSLA